MSKTKHPALFIRTNPAFTVISPDLAVEIGLNESIVLLQVEYWLRAEAVERDGHLWLRKPIRELQQAFPFWGVGSVHRIFVSLLKQHLLVRGDYDQSPGRGAGWFRLNFEQIATLRSLRVDCSNLEQRMFQKGVKSFQVGTSVLNIDLKNKNIDPPGGYKVKKKPEEPRTLHPPDDFEIDREFETWMAEMFIDLSPGQRKDALGAWHDSRRSDPTITRPRTMEQWKYDLRKFIRIYWQNSQPRNGHNGHREVNDQPMKTIQERMRLGLL